MCCSSNVAARRPSQKTKIKKLFQFEGSIFYFLLFNLILGMRISLLFFMLISALSSVAQQTLPADYTSTRNKNLRDSSFAIERGMNRKWFFTSYRSIGINFIAFNAGSATVVDAPMSLQLNRRLNNNLYAFAGVSAAPAYINFNRAFLSPGMDKLNPANGFKSNAFGLYTRADLGLMYINDARTFSISGSVGVERSSNPMLLYQQRNFTGSNSSLMPARRY